MNNRLIGVMADSLRLPFEESIIECARMKADGIQLYAVSDEMLSAPINILKQKRDFIHANGLQISALCGDLGGHGFSRKEGLAERIETSKHIVDMAVAMDCNIVTTHIGVVPEDTACETYHIMQEACGILGEYAHKNGARFAIETGPEPSIRLKHFLDSLGEHGMAVNMDPANLVMVVGEDPVEAVYNLKDYIVHTHAKDGIMLKKTDPKIIYDFFAEGGIGDLRLEEYFLETPLGQGHVNFEKYLAALKEIGYNGYLTIEREIGANPIRDIKEAVAFLSDYNLA